MIAIIQNKIAELSALSGIDENNLKIVICSFLSFPFSAIFKRLPDRNYTLKNAYIISVSAFYLFGILDITTGFRTLVLSSVGTYLITRYVRTPAMPWINFVFLMGHLASNHVHAQFFSDNTIRKIDITGSQMVLVMKLTAFGWNIYDGRSPSVGMNDYTKSRIVTEHPNILEYCGYTFFYPSLLTGPAFDFADYQKFIRSELFDDVPESKRPGRTRKRKIPRSGRVAFMRVLQGIFWAVVWVKAGDHVSVKEMLDPAFKLNNFFYKIFYLWILGFTYRLKYYAIWLIAEGGCILCGIGYNGYDAKSGKFLWNRVQNIDPWAFETGQNVHVCLEAWNMNTNKWLKNYVYLRIARPGKKPGFKSTLFTFLTSAFWHGTRPGYYLSFACGAFLQTCGKVFRRNFRPIFLQADGKTPKSSKFLYDIICYFVTQLAFGFAVQPFVLLDFKRSFYAWSTVNYFLLWGMFSVLFLFKGPLSKQVTSYIKQFHPKPIETASPELKISDSKSQTRNVQEEEEEEERGLALGVPAADFDEINKEDVEQELLEFKQQIKEWKRRGSMDAEEGLRDAYKTFTKEVSSLFPTKGSSEIKKD